MVSTNFTPQFGHQSGRMLPYEPKVRNAYERRFKLQKAHNKIGPDVTFDQWMAAGRPDTMDPEIRIRRGPFGQKHVYA